MTFKLERVLFIIIFLFTLKFELFNNLILLTYLFFNLKQIKLKSEALKFLVLPFFILIMFFLIYNNVNYIKYCVYVLRFLLILFITNQILASNKFNLRNILENIFYIHVFVIIICYFFPSFNDLLRGIFSYSGGSMDRITGLIQGYEFVPFLIVTYLSYEYIILEKKIDKTFLIKLLLGTLASLFSGRFSVIPLSILYGFIIFNKKNLILKISFFSLLFFVLTYTFDKIFFNITNTLSLVYDLIIIGFDADFSQYSRFSENSISVDQQYNLSPIILLQEALYPFMSWESHILPSSFETIDSGPSYMSLNLGFILTAYLYFFFFRTIKLYTKISVPVIVIIVFLSIDLKFRSIYVLFTTVWLVANHINYIKSKKK